jgi:hypothetical protein
MLFYDLNCLKNLCIGMLLISVFVVACAAQAYAVNLQRDEDDPEKKDYYLAAVFLAPITFLPLLLLVILLFIVRALFYCFSLFVFILALIVIRNAFLLKWITDKATYIGDKLVEANTFLIKLLIRPWTRAPGTI